MCSLARTDSAPNSSISGNLRRTPSRRVELYCSTLCDHCGNVFGALVSCGSGRASVAVVVAVVVEGAAGWDGWRDASHWRLASDHIEMITARAGWTSSGASLISAVPCLKPSTSGWMTCCWRPWTLSADQCQGSDAVQSTNGEVLHEGGAGPCLGGQIVPRDQSGV